MTAPVWFSQARRVNVGDGSGAMLGGEPRAVHHTTEGSTIDGAVATYRKTGCFPTFTIDYVKDDVVQHLPVNVGASALKNASGGVQTNRKGSVCIQIEWVGSATKPFNKTTEGKLIPAGPKVKAFFDFLRSHGIPDVWPEGAPPAYGQGGAPAYGAGNGERHAATWESKAGHYGHSQVPENSHGDPGAIDPGFVKQTARAAAVTPKPTATTQPNMVQARTRQLQGLLGVPQTGSVDSPTTTAMSRNLIGWQPEVDKKAHRHVGLTGNTKPLLVKWVQSQMNRKFDPDQPVDGVPGEKFNHILVAGLHQTDSICGPAAYKALLQ